jgi:hypothetical protein
MDIGREADADADAESDAAPLSTRIRSDVLAFMKNNFDDVPILHD